MSDPAWPRRKTRSVRFLDLTVSGQDPIRVESMTKTDTRDIEATSGQIERLAQRGCELVRVAVPDEAAGKALKGIVSRSRIPVMADIHFDYRLALEAVRSGVHGLRVNPGNLGEDWKAQEIARAAGDAGLPIRVGVNAGSLARGGGERPARAEELAARMVEAGLREAEVLEKAGLDQILISFKAFDLRVTLLAHRMAAACCDLPFHAGITEAGPAPEGLVRSAAGLGLLVAEGLVDTLRVSLTDEPETEVEAGYSILSSMGLRQRGPILISCPTCGRCETDLKSAARRVRDALRDLDFPITVAVMGCPVNGPGEAKHADVGIAAGRGKAVLFAKGRPIRTVPEPEMVQALLEACRAWHEGEGYADKKG